MTIILDKLFGRFNEEKFESFLHFEEDIRNEEKRGMAMRIMGLDYGAKTVGVAISDELLLTAQPIETITRERETKLRKTLARIEELMEEYQVGKVIIGLPKKLNNEEGERCKKTREFAEMVEQRSGLEVILWDERLTTVSADAVLAEGHVAKEKRKTYIDKLAASFILEGYLKSISDK